MSKKCVTAAMIAGMAMLGGAGGERAMASFTIDQGPPPGVQQVQSQSLPVPGGAGPTSLIPPRPVEHWTDMVAGFGHPQSVEALLLQTAPDGTHWSFGSPADGARTSFYKGNVTRKDAVDLILANVGLAVIDGAGTPNLTIGKPAAATVQQSSAAAQVAQPPKIASVPAPDIQRDEDTDASGGGTQQWVVTAQSSMHDVLLKWCQAAGWTLDWKAKDRNFIASAAFKGRFEDAASKLLGLYTTGRAPIRAHFHGGSKVLSVWNLTDSNPSTN